MIRIKDRKCNMIILYNWISQIDCLSFNWQEVHYWFQSSVICLYQLGNSRLEYSKYIEAYLQLQWPVINFPNRTQTSLTAWHLQQKVSYQDKLIWQPFGNEKGNIKILTHFRLFRELAITRNSKITLSKYWNMNR